FPGAETAISADLNPADLNPADSAIDWEGSENDSAAEPEPAIQLAAEARSEEKEASPETGSPLVAEVAKPAERIDEISSLTDLLAETSLDEQTRSELTALMPPATDAATQELFDQTLGRNAARSPQPSSVAEPATPQPEAATHPTEDHYPLASPDEDLLPDLESAAESDSALWLDEAILSSLDQDLSSLEQGNELAGQSLSRELTDGTDWTLAEWGVEAPQTTASEQQPARSEPPEPTLEELAESLTEANADLEVIPSPPAAAALPATGQVAFTLEGMDDLFADVPPVVPSVSPVPPPAANDQAAAFTLEGMDDLFGDLSAAPAVSSVPPPGSSSSGQPEVGQQENPGRVSSPITPSASAPSVASTQPAAFTLEGIDDLFADMPATMMPATMMPASPIAQPTPGNLSSAFTLEDAENLFADVPAASSAPVSPESASFTLEGMDDLFPDAPAASPPPATAALGAETELQNGFTLDQVGDLFGEGPGEAGTPGSQGSPADTIATESFASPSPATPPNPEDLTLEQAFESLMGLLDSSPSPQAPAGSNPQTLEKKKKGN
ncbi:MAG: hypothetical protein WCA35_27545, partial [Kovacikia sp.]